MLLVVVLVRACCTESVLCSSSIFPPFNTLRSVFDDYLTFTARWLRLPRAYALNCDKNFTRKGGYYVKENFYCLQRWRVVMMIEMPFAASAATVVKNAVVNKPQIRVQIGPQRHRRWRRDYDRGPFPRRSRTIYFSFRSITGMGGYRRVRYTRVWRNY